MGGLFNDNIPSVLIQSQSLICLDNLNQKNKYYRNDYND